MAPTKSARFSSTTMARSSDLDDQISDGPFLSLSLCLHVYALMCDDLTGLTIDQGIACVLMLVALALTYLIH
ncbi:hypothetical protein QVD17_35626 [Tagetes erecta]|uniref:Uncharacterized protein n=1 Tax=Tagetes erecta TaxID=13708 RepID=A0AAD8JT05_TARER|nr:hypothetical protein QVD17_35626 [Tagetes erecta]